MDNAAGPREQIRGWVLAAAAAGGMPTPNNFLAMSLALGGEDPTPIGPYEATLWAIMRRIAEVWRPGGMAFAEAARTLNAAEVMFKTSGEVRVTRKGFCVFYRPERGRRIVLAGAQPSGDGAHALAARWQVRDILNDAKVLRAAWRGVEQRVGREWWDG